MSASGPFGLMTDSIQLKRQHSAEPLNAGSPATRKSPALDTPKAESPPPDTSKGTSTPPTFGTGVTFDTGSQKADDVIVGSPMKKQRASLSGLDDELMQRRHGLGLMSGEMGNVLGPIDTVGGVVKKEQEEEL